MPRNALQSRCHTWPRGGQSSWGRTWGSWTPSRSGCCSSWWRCARPCRRGSARARSRRRASAHASRCLRNQIIFLHEDDMSFINSFWWKTIIIKWWKCLTSIDRPSSDYLRGKGITDCWDSMDQIRTQIFIDGLGSETIRPVSQGSHGTKIVSTTTLAWSLVGTFLQKLIRRFAQFCNVQNS